MKSHRDVIGAVVRVKSRDLGMRRRSERGTTAAQRADPCGRVAAMEDRMKRIIYAAVMMSTLGGFPALAEEREPTRGSDRDPFSQTYTGRDVAAVRAEADRASRETSPCMRSCPCARHDGGHNKPSKQ
jgi:hypothetical protein